MGKHFVNICKILQVISISIIPIYKHFDVLEHLSPKIAWMETCSHSKCDVLFYCKSMWCLQDVEKELEVQIGMKQEMELSMKMLEKDICEKQDALVELRQQLEDIRGINQQLTHKSQVILHFLLLPHQMCTCKCKTFDCLVCFCDIDLYENVVRFCLKKEKNKDAKHWKEQLFKVTIYCFVLE